MFLETLEQGLEGWVKGEKDRQWVPNGFRGAREEGLLSEQMKSEASRNERLVPKLIWGAEGPSKSRLRRVTSPGVFEGHGKVGTGAGTCPPARPSA